MDITVSRKAHFNAAHRLYNKNWSDQENSKEFGKCSNPNYHGHNYELIVNITGKINPETGYVYDLGKLKKLIKSHDLIIVSDYGHGLISEKSAKYICQNSNI